jgi:hypothetical protein
MSLELRVEKVIREAGCPQSRALPCLKACGRAALPAGFSGCLHVLACKGSEIVGRYQRCKPHTEDNSYLLWGGEKSRML